MGRKELEPAGMVRAQALSKWEEPVLRCAAGAILLGFAVFWASPPPARDPAPRAWRLSWGRTEQNAAPAQRAVVEPRTGQVHATPAFLPVKRFPARPKGMTRALLLPVTALVATVVVLVLQPRSPAPTEPTAAATAVEAGASPPTKPTGAADPSQGSAPPKIIGTPNAAQAECCPPPLDPRDLSTVEKLVLRDLSQPERDRVLEMCLRQARDHLAVRIEESRYKLDWDEDDILKWEGACGVLDLRGLDHPTSELVKSRPLGEAIQILHLTRKLKRVKTKDELTSGRAYPAPGIDLDLPAGTSARMAFAQVLRGVHSRTAHWIGDPPPLEARLRLQGVTLGQALDALTKAIGYEWDNCFHGLVFWEAR